MSAAADSPGCVLALLLMPTCWYCCYRRVARLRGRAQVLAEKAKAATHPAAKAVAKHAAAKEEAAHGKSADNYGADILQVCAGVHERACQLCGTMCVRHALPLRPSLTPFLSLWRLQMMAHANKAGGHGIARPHARGSINPLGVGSIVRALLPPPVLGAALRSPGAAAQAECRGRRHALACLSWRTVVAAKSQRGRGAEMRTVRV